MNKNVKYTKKPYCKVCHDVGKPESDYTSHWVRDHTGKTICPTLLNTECRYCHRFGHTAKFCDVVSISKRELEIWNHSIQGEPKYKQPTQTNNQSYNSFSLLCDDVGSKEEVRKTNNNINNEEPVNKPNWAAIAAKPKQVIPMSKSCLVELNRCGVKDSNQKSEKTFVETNIAHCAPKDYVKPVKKNWADWTESEDESEDEYYEDDAELFDDNRW